MTENEARLILDVRISRFDHAGDVNEALEIAKQALEEIQQYRKIGTVEECREAVERARSLDAYVKQVCWERDLAVQQLSEIGISLGENMDTVKEALKKSIKKGDAK